MSTCTNVSYAWAFGDGATGSGATVTITGSGPVTATRAITTTYDGLHRLTGAAYSPNRS